MGETMGVRDPSPECRIRSVSRCQPVTFKCPHATETNVAPSRAATGPPPASSHCLPPWHRWMVVPAAPVRAPRGAGRGTAYALCLIRCAGRCPLTHKPFWWLE